MLARTLLTRSLTRSLVSTNHLCRLPIRCITTEPEHKSWLTRKVEDSPAAKKWFLGLTKLLGYGSPKQLAGRRAFVLYEHIVAAAPDQHPDFWKNGILATPSNVKIHPLISHDLQHATSRQHSNRGLQSRISTFGC